MLKSKIKILSIDPGTRELGVALLQNGDLIYHGVKDHQEAGPPRRKG